MSGWLPACLSCRFAHNKDGMPLCQNWVRSACIGGHGNSCRNRHYYTQYDAALPKPAQPAAPPSSVLTEFSSPLVTRVQKVTEHHKRVEIDLETGKRKSFIETTEQEIIDITGNKENTPVKAPVAQLSKTSKNLKVNLLKKFLAPSQLLSKNNSSEEESTQNSDPGENTKMSENDVNWTKPRQSFKIKKGGSYKKSTDRKEISSSSRGSVTLPLSKPAQPPGHNKRRNPFSQHNEEAQAEKRRKLSTNFLSQDSEFSVSSSDSRDSGVGSSHSQSGDLFPNSFITGHNSGSNNTLPQDESLKPLSLLPMDWSLKNRATFTSPQSWLWGEHLSTVEAASSVTGGVRCLNIADGAHCLDTSASTQFHAACLYWQHPSLPGLPLYPRFGQTRVSKEPLRFSPEMNRFIFTEWINSLQAVYQLVKARQCPFFYVCHSSFTCLFRAAGVGGSQQMMALLTPTTSGIRAALRREDVEYTMPLKNVKEDSDQTAGQDTVGKLDEEPSDILETLGIEANSLPGFTQTVTKNMTQTGVQLDGKADSLVYVEGVECQSLLNYLLNAKLNQDPGGVPPTVLAPVAFPGAVLKSMKVKEHLLTGRGDGTKNHQIDVQGPIMPHTLHILTNLSVNHAPNTHVRLTTLESTASLSAFSLPADSVAPSAFASANLKDCGLPDSLLKSFCQVRSGPEEVTVIRELNFRKGRFQLIDTGLGEKTS